MPLKFDALKHPRDRRGRFTKSRTVRASAADRKAVKQITGGFKPAKTGDGKTYAAKIAQPEQRKAAGSFAPDAKAINEDLRAGHADAPGVKPMDAAMKPLPEDLVLHRSVPAEAFGDVDPASLQGMKVRDAGFAATQLDAHEPSADDVRMFIAAPQGSRAVVNPGTGEVYLDRDSEMVVSRVEKNPAGGHDMYLTLLPKAGGKNEGTSAQPAKAKAEPNVPAEPDAKTAEKSPAKSAGETVKKPGPEVDKPQGEAEFRASLMKQKVTDLQAQMRERGLKPGKKRKSELVDALVGDEMGHDNAAGGTKSEKPASVETASPEPAGNGPVEDRIKSAIEDLIAAHGGEPDRHHWLMVSDVRKKLPDVGKAEFDAAANRLVTKDPDVALAPESNQKALTAEQRAGAVVRGNQDRHLIGLEGNPNRAPSPASGTGGSATGAGALAAAPLGLHREGVDLPGPQADALTAYQDGRGGVTFKTINGALRAGTTGRDSDAKAIAGIDAAMAGSKLTSAVEVWRGVRNPSAMFGDQRMAGDLTGLRWREDGFVSTTTDQAATAPFAGSAEPLRMRITASAGTGVVDLSDPGDPSEAELLLDRGHEFEVVADRGLVAGVREVEVRVLPKAGDGRG